MGNSAFPQETSASSPGCSLSGRSAAGCGPSPTQPRFGGEASAPSTSIGAVKPGRGVDEDSRTVDFFTRLHMAWTISSEDQSALAIAEAVSTLDADKVRAALAQLKKGRFAGRMDVISQLFTRWGELDPQAALEYAQALTDHAQSNAAVLADGRCVGGNRPIRRGSVDLRTAARTIEKFRDGGIRSLPAATEPERALQLAAATDIPRNMADGVVDALFNQWAQRDPAAAARAVALASGRRAPPQSD